MFDVLIQNGRIIDGTGQTWFRGSIGVTGDTVSVLRGDISAVAATKVIDASGYMVCPGFIDMHSHSELMMLSEPKHEAKVRQGVTTEAIGMDGLSYAPSSPANLELLLGYLAAVNGTPPPDVRWGSVKEFLDLFEGRASCNVAYFVPHAAIRAEAMGWEDRLPTAAEIGRMQELARQGMRDGAFGFSTGLTYAPGAYSDTDELVAVCQAIRDLGGFYMTHARYSLGDRLLDPFREALTIGRLAKVPVHISHYHNPVDGMGEKMVALVDEGRNSDIDVTFDQYPYPAASTVLHSLLPYWVHSGGPTALMQRIKDRRIRDEIGDSVDPQWGMTLDHYIFSHIKSDKNKEWEGRSLTDLAKSRGTRMVDTICDLLIEEDLEVAFVARTGNPDNIRTIVKHPAQMVGSDGLLTGGHPNPRSYGTFPYVLGQLVREEGLLQLEEAVRKMSAIPAQRLGLKDRGILRDGMKADLVLFDPQRVASNATFDQPKQYPEGIDYVMVNGKLVIDNGAHTGAMSGRALKSQ
ncbi:MAG: D-aminoacylase [Chloroflexi bacterium]|nr:D-aminoacylase [Chloroflexota bacterium]MDA1217858.1 D-aminoacylase [Chloroflexota bacterium]